MSATSPGTRRHQTTSHPPTPEGETMPRRRSATVTVSLVAALSVAMTGCGGTSDDPDYRGVCVDKTTQKRVDDKDCKDGKGGGSRGFVYIGRGGTIPPIGSAVSGGTTTIPKGASVALGGAPAKGGTVARGGFGGGGAKGGSVGG